MRPCLNLSGVSIVLFVAATSMAGSKETAEAFSSSQSNEIPQLPPPDPNSNLPSIKLGESIRFEEWGPIILNSDGTTRRIANWDEMTDREKEVTWRRISKRNEERRVVLLEQQKLEEEQRAAEAGSNEAKEDL